jgi:hypothetical protein
VKLKTGRWSLPISFLIISEFVLGLAQFAVVRDQVHFQYIPKLPGATGAEFYDFSKIAVLEVKISILTQTSNKIITVIQR